MSMCAETTRGSTEIPNVLLGGASFKRKGYKHVNIPLKKKRKRDAEQGSSCASLRSAEGWQSVRALFGDIAEVCLSKGRGKKGRGCLKSIRKHSLPSWHWTGGFSLLPWSPSWRAPGLSPAPWPSFAPCPGCKAPPLPLPLSPVHHPWAWEASGSIPKHSERPWEERGYQRGAEKGVLGVPPPSFL